MSNIVILGDLHIGARGSSKLHHSYMKTVLDDMFRFIEESGIKYVIQTGDLFDDRKVLHLWAWDFFDTVIQPKIEELGLTWYQIVGNHDSHYRDTLSINTPRLKLSDHPHVTVIDEPTEVIIEGEKFLLIPWINKTNQNSVMELVKTTDAKFCCGHFEFDGFDLYKGNPAKGHFKHSEFSKFERVYSGHYHTFSAKDNVVYTGTPYELTWQDCQDDKCYIIHKKGEGYEKVLTLHTLYVKIEFDPDNLPKPEQIKNKIVRVVVKNRPDKLIFNSFIQALEKMEPHELKIQELFADDLSEEKASVDITRTRDVIVEYLDGSKIDLDKDKILSIFDELYSIAITEVD